MDLLTRLIWPHVGIWFPLPKTCIFSSYPKVAIVIYIDIFSLDFYFKPHDFLLKKLIGKINIPHISIFCQIIFCFFSSFPYTPFTISFSRGAYILYRSLLPYLELFTTRFHHSYLETLIPCKSFPITRKENTKSLRYSYFITVIFL